jgi:hypothetical protein
MKVIQCEQGSEEWYEARLGRPTASQFHKIVTPGGKPSRQAQGYMYRLIAETLLHESMDDYLGSVQWIERGKMLEGDAAAQFEFTHNVELESVGLVTTDDGTMACSPDRLVAGRRAAVEIKCPAPWTHLGYLLDGPGADYRPQVQGQLMIGEFEQVVFYSYHPRCPAAEFVAHRDEPYIRVMRQLLRDFREQLAAALDRARALGIFLESHAMQTPMARAYPESGPDPLQVLLGESE